MRRFTAGLLMLACLAIGPAALADEAITAPDDPDAYLTVNLLDTVEVPPLDPVRLAAELRGVSPDTDADASRPAPTVGLRDQFWVSDLQNSFQVEAELLAIGEHSYIWVESGAPVSRDEAETLAQAFDTQVYEPVRALWGPEPSPGIDGDTRLHILFAYNLGAGTGAYFTQRHAYPDEVLDFSNEREMFFVNLSAFGTNIATQEMITVLAHEFQHMIRFNQDVNEATWLNEGYSTFTEYTIDPAATRRYPGYFLPVPDTQLNTFGLVGTSTDPNYGAGFLFVTYFYQRFGPEGIARLSEQTANGMQAVDIALAALGGPDADGFFADWVLANLINNPDFADGLYSYPPDVLMMPPAGQFIRADEMPLSLGRSAAPYSTTYYDVRGLDGQRTLEVRLDMPGTTRLIPTDAYDGSYMWYGNRADSSMTTLTRSFDLGDVETATLEFQSWYAIEENWDYAYVMASRDNAITWEILPTNHTTLENPFGNSYGPAFTGYSAGWVQQQADLSTYAGDEVLVRFAYITDDAVNEPGFAVDAITIPEIGYSTSAESSTDADGWQSDGWLRMDNILPQRAWVQVVSYAGDQPLAVTRLHAAGDDAPWTIELPAATTRAVVAVSPYAPLTTVPVEYTLTFNAR
ncbi:MAG: hypothetical protein ACOCYT_02565 [Chloroflexota bacterium]